MTLTIDWGAAATLIAMFASVSVPLTAWILRGIINASRSSMYVKAVDFVRVETEFHGFREEFGEMKEWLGKKLESIDRKLDR